MKLEIILPRLPCLIFRSFRLLLKQQWFIVLIVVIVALILYGIYLYRLQQIKRLQIIRNNIASDLHDDIGSTLNSISIYSEVAKQQAGKEIPCFGHDRIKLKKNH
jgi:hypothetical protein